MEAHDPLVAEAVRLLRASQRTQLVTTGNSSAHIRQQVSTVVVIDGKRLKVSLDPSGTAIQIEEDNALHAIVQPRTVKVIGNK